MSSKNGTESADELYDEESIQFELTDESYEELAALEGAVVVGVSFWDSSMVDELEEEETTDENRMVIDLDVYLEDNSLLELYGAVLYPSAESEPVTGLAALEQALVDLVDSESELNEVAQTEDGGLALIFAAGEALKLIVTAGGWTISEWDELPQE